MRRALVGSVATAVLLMTVACGGGPSGPSGPLASAINVASKQQVTDLAFETFLSDLELEPAVADQIRASRAAVHAQVKPIKLTSFAARQGMRVEATGVFMVLMYATTLADSLDPMTGGRNAGGETRPNPLQSTTTGGDTTTTTFLNITMNLNGAGSKVTLSMHWTYRETTTNTKTGEKLVDITDDRTMVGTIDVCPNDSGISPATLEVHIQLTKSGSGRAASRTSSSSNTFTGHVDDQAVLRRVTHDMQQTASWQNGSGTGGYEFNSNGLNWNSGESGVSGGLDSSGVAGSLSSNGSATNDQVTREAGGTMAIDKTAVEAAYTQAQKLWRNGRCVVLQAPDYHAETPLAVASQEKVQHDEEVDPDSKTKFAVSMKHRFGGSLSKPVKATMSGDKKLEPTEVKTGSGSLTYTAPGEDDRQATVTLKSVSKRGIGTLVIAFHTKGKHLKLTVKGTATVQPLSAPILTLQWNVTIGPADFHKVGDNTWEATAPTKGQGAYVKLPLPNCKIAFTETGSVTLVAKKDVRGDKSVWVVRMDQERSTATLAAASCVGGATNQVPTGGYSVQALNDVGEVVIPAEGGTVTQRGSHPIPGTTGSSTLTFTATVTAE